MFARRLLRPALLALGLLCAAPAALAQPNEAPASAEALEIWTRDAVSPEADVADAAIAALRAQGPAGLTALLDAHAEAVEGLPERWRERGSLSEEDARLRRAIDGVARQRDAFASRLYWYTDLEAAQAAARAEGKAVLSLRLLGELDEELSCANSRFFRTLLYPDPAVSEQMRERFVLHWSSERPAPVVTVDYGDGRVITRTVTGNSIHYVLNAEGRVLDAIPGLMAPGVFATRLSEAAELAGAVRGLEGEALAGSLRDAHARKSVELSEGLQQALASVDGTWAPEPPPALPRPTARDAAPRAVGKMVVEVDLVAALEPPPTLTEEEEEEAWALAETVEPKTWRALVEATRSSVTIGPESRAMIQLKHRRLGAPETVLEGEALDAVVEGFKDALIQDSLQNTYQLYATLQTWLKAGEGPPSFATFNAHVYDTLFLTPASDPWLGLFPEGAYPAIERGGQ